MPTWPAGLPQDALLPARDKKQNAVQSTDMDAGPPTTRNRFTAVSRMFSPTMELTTAQLNTFYTFFENDIANGALAFDWTDPVTNTTKSMKFHRGSTPDWQAIGGGWWRATLDLEILP